MTYSIVARDPTTGQIGVAVQTCNLAVGTWVPWAAAGVGAVATQSHADRTYGTLGLQLMRGGKPAQQALSALLATDQQREFRQVAFVDWRGNVAVHTGSRCLPYAGHQAGDGFCVQANMMARATVWAAMAGAYSTSKGDLATRLLAALDAAQSEGGDLRGQQTAAMLIVGPELGPHTTGDFPLLDLRVDYHPQPVDELRRLVQLHYAYAGEYTIPALVAQGLLETAYHRLNQIAQAAPDEGYLHFLRAYHLAARLERWEEAVAVMRRLTSTDPLWLEYLRRDVQTDTFDAPGLAARFLDALTDNSPTTPP